MGLNDTNSASARGTKAFTRDVLSIEIAGPDRPQLTLVDLPGLIQTATDEQTQEDVTLIHELVNDYITEGRTIMLTVVSAKNDYANQGIIDKARRADPEGHRTLGIVTKPDYLKPKSKNEEAWINLVQNKSIVFQLGWHILKNRTEDELGSSFADRNNAEHLFLNLGAYRALPPQSKGIASLRTRLAQLLYKHLKRELPKLQNEIRQKLQDTTTTLKDLGGKRSTYEEQKRFLVTFATDFQTIVKAAADGNYEHDFFTVINPLGGFDDPANSRRLRAAVQHMNIKFAEQMRCYGHKYRIEANKDVAGAASNSNNGSPALDLEDYNDAKDLPQNKTRDEAVVWVKQLLVRSRGRELPGTFNPLLMSQLFWEQSQNWHDLALAHIDRVDNLCSSFIRMAIDHVTLDDVSQRLQGMKLDNSLKARHEKAKQELAKLIEDKQQLITYDPNYTSNFEEMRNAKMQARIMEVVNQASIEVENKDGESRRYVNPDGLDRDCFKVVVDQDMDRKSAEDALDSQVAYYKNEVNYFINAVTKQVVERHMLQHLADETLSPLIINDMTEDEVAFIAAEAEEITQRRGFLDGHKTILENGQDAFRKALGAFR